MQLLLRNLNTFMLSDNSRAFDILISYFTTVSPMIPRMISLATAFTLSTFAFLPCKGMMPTWAYRPGILDSICFCCAVSIFVDLRLFFPTADTHSGYFSIPIAPLIHSPLRSLSLVQIAEIIRCNQLITFRAPILKYCFQHSVHHATLHLIGVACEEHI